MGRVLVCVVFSGVTADPEWEPQDRIKKTQPLRKRQSEHVGLVGQMDVQLGQPIAPASAEEERSIGCRGSSRSAASCGSCSPWPVVIAFNAVASSQRTVVLLLERSHQLGREGRPQEPPAKQQGLRGGAPGAPCFGGADEALDAVLRRGSEKGVDIGKPFKPVPPVERAVHAEIGKEIFLAQRAQSRSPGQGYDSRRRHDRSLGHGMRVQEQPPVQLDPQSGRLVDESEIFAERH